MSAEPTQLSLGLAPAPQGSDPEPGPAGPAAAKPAGRTPQQLAAVDSPAPYTFVEAGAGSGKTGVLTDRYCDAVEASEAGADAVLAFTFTEKAASELRSRIRTTLRARAEAAGREGDEAGARRLLELAREPGAWVTTIHGFCHRLIASHPIAAGVDPGFRVLDASEAGLIADRAFARAYERFLADPDSGRLEIAAAGPREQLRATVVGAHDELRALGEIDPRLPELGAADLEAAVSELHAAAAAALAATGDAGGSKVAGDHDRFRLALELNAGGLEGSDPDSLARLLPQSGAKAFDCAEIERYRAAVAALITPLAARLYDSARELVALFAAEYRDEKARRAGLDFEDLQLVAVELLERSEPIRARWSERFESILVDEFQDTNRLQVRLIDLLCGAGTTLFTVGDEHQSIYGFRHADVSVFRAERGRAVTAPLTGNFRSDPEVLALVNLVGATLLDGFEALVAERGTAPERDPGAAAPDPVTELIAVERDGWGEEAVGLEDRGGIDAPPARIAEAAALAARLAELHEAGVPRAEMVVLLRAFTNVTAYEEALERAGLRPLIVGGRGYWSQQQVEDMRALLGVIANPLDDERLLGALSSPACGVGPATLWCLRRAAGRGRHLWPALCALDEERPGSDTGEEDEAAVERDRALTAIEDSEAAKLRRFGERVGSLREQAAALPLDSLVDRVATGFGYDLAVLQRERGRRRWANVRKLIALARRHEETEGRDLPGFLASIDARTERDEAEPEAATELEGHDGVRLMTIHNAKGLEFATVAVADLGRGLSGGGFPPAFRARPDGDRRGLRTGLRLARAGRKPLRLLELEQLQAEAASDEAEEECRLVYVAASRARHRLLLAGTIDAGALEGYDPDAPRPSDSAMTRLLVTLGIGSDGEALTAADGSALGSAAEVEIPPAPGTEPSAPVAVAVSYLTPAPGAGAKLIGGPEAGDEPPAIVLGEGGSTLARLAAEPDPPTPAGHLSNASIETFRRCGYRFYAEQVLRLPRRAAPGANGAGAARSGAAAFGSAVHAILEWSARNRWAEPDHQRCATALGAAGAPADAEQVERALAMVGAWTRSRLCEELRGATALPEAPFLLAASGTVVRGSIDLLVRRPGRPPLVVDYKTNALGGAEPAAMMAPYERQRDLYALAAAGAPSGESVLAETAFVFLERADEPVVLEHALPQLDEARERLEADIASIRDGRFEVTEHPHRGLCADCPARERLCPHPAERTMAPSPEQG